MALKLSNKIKREDLRRGDHIYAYRKLAMYSHHGIFIGGDRVIHYNSTNDGVTSRGRKCSNCGLDEGCLRGVVESCVDCFLKGHKLRRFRYGVSYARFLFNRAGTCTVGQSDTPDVTVGRANDLYRKIYDFGDYHLLENNCEAFAVFCKTGRRVSCQASAAEEGIKGVVKVNRDRLLREVRVHQGEEQHNRLRQVIDNWLAQTLPLPQIINNLQRDYQEGH